MITTDPKTIEKVRLFVLACAPNANGLWGALAGDRHKDSRRHIMQTLIGQPQPFSKCGVNATMQALFEIAKISDHMTNAAREDALADWLRGNLPAGPEDQAEATAEQWGVWWMGQTSFSEAAGWCLHEDADSPKLFDSQAQAQEYLDGLSTTFGFYQARPFTNANGFPVVIGAADLRDMEHFKAESDEAAANAQAIPAELAEVHRLACLIGIRRGVSVALDDQKGLWNRPALLIGGMIYIEFDPEGEWTAEAIALTLAASPGAKIAAGAGACFRVYAISEFPGSTYHGEVIEGPWAEAAGEKLFQHAHEAARYAFEFEAQAAIDAILQGDSERRMDQEIKQAEDQAEQIERRHAAADEAADQRGGYAAYMAGFTDPRD